MIAKTGLFLCLTLVLGGGLLGCSSEIAGDKKVNSNESLLPKADPVAPSRVPAAYEAVTNAINQEDWKFLRGLTRKGMTANRYIEYWQKAPVRVGGLISVEKDFSFNGKQCTKYSFRLSSRDGKNYPHQLQLIVGSEDSQSVIMDFWEFGW